MISGAVLGISSSSRSQLVAEIDALGTNLLTVAPNQAFAGQSVTSSGYESELPRVAPADLARARKSQLICRLYP